ncbi:MAG: FtsX-like permease family protein [Erysipelotrichaceae bacterium]|nr:FtsX-like permease family protein [Erysipelotrichaceae bacterium]
MGSALWKDILREIKNSRGRFLSIMMIVAIGVAFFAGVKASIPDMKHTADRYFDEYHLMDLRILSDFGITEEDVEAIREVAGIEGVFPTYSMDVLAYDGSNQLVFKVHALPEDLSEDNADYINRVKLVEGRLPQTGGECVIEQGGMQDSGFQIGDTISLTSGTSKSLSDTLKHTEYKIVGKVQTPYYLSYEKGSSAIGGGKVNFFMMIPQADITMEVYTEVFLSVKGVRELNSYEDAYFDAMESIRSALSSLGNTRSDLRFAQIKAEAQEELAKGERDYQEGVTQFEQTFREQEQKLEDAKSELILGRAQLSAQQERYADKFADYRVQIAEGKQQLVEAKSAYESGMAQFEETKQSLEQQIEQVDERLNEVLTQIAENEAEIKKTEEMLQNPDLSELERALLQERLETLKRTKQIAEATIPYLEPIKQALQLQLANAQQELQQAGAQIKQNEALLAQKEQELIQGEQQAKQEFAQAQERLNNGQKEYISAKVRLTQEKENGQKELDIAQAKLEKGKADLEDLQAPQWYILDRHSHYSYMDYGSVADRMEGIAKIFPLFFFLVAALVCLTTMTRMVDEQRSAIGTMKALGYGKQAIAAKFIVYALIAGICGSILGCTIGMHVFPLVIFNAWNLMYTLPSISFAPQPLLAFSASFIVTGITALAAYGAVYKELVETPALLMRPKAPKAGKKILLERIDWLWKRCSFTQKVTARNLFRYKKRFFMTVVGVSGCTALLVAGFGIQDSIATIVDKQYQEIIKYDMAVQLSDDATTTQREALAQHFKDDAQIQDYMEVTMDSGTAIVDQEEQLITIVVPNDTLKFQNFVSLHARGENEELPLVEDGVIISEKLAMNAGVSVGDQLEISEGDGIRRQVRISAIVENYVGHYVYFTPTYYKQIFHISPLTSAFIAQLREVDPALEESLGSALMEREEVVSVSFYSGIAANFADTIASLSIVVVVLVIAAGMLAFVVLYNLTNVNISERMREIATIKVLGFYDLEVAEYVYRENIILTMIGALCGLVLGIGLHALIMNLAEMESVMFGRNIDASSFLISFVITLGFGMLVNLVMYRRLKRIPMVESLKSVE